MTSGVPGAERADQFGDAEALRPLLAAFWIDVLELQRDDFDVARQSLLESTS